jgi:hypothetical protein
MSRYNTRKQRWIKKLLPSEKLKESYQQKIYKETINKWLSEGMPAPPPHIVKVNTVASYAKTGKYKVLVETGTFMGDMIEAQQNNFEQIYSIELSVPFWEKAKEKFKSQPHIKLLQGDSGQVMQNLIQEINQPAIFWLDGHYSGGNTALGEKVSPIFEELEAIFTSKLEHCILIDDARLFDGKGDYPSIEEVKRFIFNHRNNTLFKIEADTIHVSYTN